MSHFSNSLEFEENFLHEYLIFFLFEIHLGFKAYATIQLTQNHENQERGIKLHDSSKIKPWVLSQMIRIFLLFMAMLFPLVVLNSLHLFLIYQGDLNFADNPSKAPIIFSYAQQIFNQLKTNTAEIWNRPSDINFWSQTLWNNLGAIFCLVGACFN